jgi:hypothetical protein
MSDSKKPAPLPQNPSPMADSIRAHERVEDRAYPGVRATIDDLLPQPVHLFLPKKLETVDECALLVHFHGEPFVSEYAVHVAALPHALAVVNLGAGSGVYERPFSAAGLFAELLSAIKKRVTAKITRIHFSAFSAGYGAVRAILHQDPDAADGVILLDGLHASYAPDRIPLAEGGQVEPTGLAPFLTLAQRAIAGEQRFLFTHSCLFPGTYASTTECADYLVQTLELKRTPLLRWGVLGMQQLAETSEGHLSIMAFAGNTAPDHVDHFHALYHFLHLLTLPTP